jgi:hypothetical protein
MYEAERALGTTREPGLGAAGPGEPSSGPSLAATVSSGTNRICISIKYDFQVENMDIDGSRAGLGPPGQGSEQPGEWWRAGGPVNSPDAPAQPQWRGAAPRRRAGRPPVQGS